MQKLSVGLNLGPGEANAASSKGDLVGIWLGFFFNQFWFPVIASWTWIS